MAAPLFFAIQNWHCTHTWKLKRLQSCHEFLSLHYWPQPIKFIGFSQLTLSAATVPKLLLGDGSWEDTILIHKGLLRVTTSSRLKKSLLFVHAASSFFVQKVQMVAQK